MDKLVENHLTIFQNYQSLNSLNPDDLVLVLDTILNIDRCSNQYFHEIRDHMIKYYHKEEDSVNELLNILGGSCPKGRLSEQKKSCGG